MDFMKEDPRKVVEKWIDITRDIEAASALDEVVEQYMGSNMKLRRVLGNNLMSQVIRAWSMSTGEILPGRAIMELQPFYPKLSGDPDNPMVDIFRNADDLLSGKRTTLRLGKFLNRIGVDNSVIQECVAAARVALSPSEDVVKFAITAKDIKRVYLHGPSSCMKYSSLVFTVRDSSGQYADRHPSEAYAYPVTRTSMEDSKNNLAVAYIERDRNVLARAVVNMKHKTFSRVYGGDNELMGRLLELGYKQKIHGTVADEPLELLVLMDDECKFLAPYVDGHDGLRADVDRWCVYTCEDSDPGYCEMDSDHVYDIDGSRVCDSCGESRRTVDYYDDVGEYLCTACVENSYVWARFGRGSYVLRDREDDELVWVDYTCYADVDAAMNDGWVVDFNGEWQAQDSCTECRHCGEWVHDDEAIESYDGSIYCTHCARRYLTEAEDADGGMHVAHVDHVVQDCGTVFVNEAEHGRWLINNCQLTLLEETHHEEGQAAEVEWA